MNVTGIPTKNSSLCHLPHALESGGRVLLAHHFQSADKPAPHRALILTGCSYLSFPMETTQSFARRPHPTMLPTKRFPIPP
ncbi:hypothetical protein RF55_13778 [Lasius niger]|uniref:Uncharacterized protein n=1 Tax=Lasius niger TaxID=67767 RepID=A0A0J7K9Z1_LASNI|nr:hypothetical protein RF55_13778 [Lasius niger]